MDITKYFLIALSFACVSSFVTPAHAQSSRSSASTKSTQPAESRTGARFVISNPIGGSLPSTLYYCTATGYFYPITVNSRLPSKRLAYPSNGRYYFWDKNPNPQQILPSADGKITAAQAAAAKAQRAEVKIPPPFLTVAVASGVSSRSICILQPRVTETADGKKKQTALATFLSESSIPNTGQSILNLSRYPIYLMVSQKGDYSDKKQVMIKPCANVKDIESGNIYNFSGSTGQKISFILNVKFPTKSEPQRLKASSFVVSNKQVQVAIVLNDPNKPTVKLETLQIMRSSSNN